MGELVKNLLSTDPSEIVVMQLNTFAIAGKGTLARQARLYPGFAAFSLKNANPASDALI
jgi:hypothetical protein